ncbi:MAG: lipase family protein [Bacteroidetes bacterium]|nr:lipase family protein [Bacteroidota bacterium]
MKKFILLITFSVIIILLNINSLKGQNKLKPGFDPYEYKSLLEILAKQSDTSYSVVKFPDPENYQIVYRSEVVGLDNRWDLWVSSDSVGVISIRGTTLKLESWLEDFYAGMIPACGALQIDSNKIFRYKLANESNASVHVGWVVGLYYLVPSIIEKINEYYGKGIKEYLIMGHSQGASIAYLLRSYLYYTGKEKIPDDVQFKTYCSAAPKPGNLFYSYDFEFITKGGWAYRIANTQDWVPEMPFSIQTVDDMVKVNPFSEVDMLLKKMKPLERFLLKAIYSNMMNSVKKAQKKFRKYLGYKVYKLVNEELVNFEEPDYAKTMYYVTCGNPIILTPTTDAYENYIKQQKRNLFENHLITPYYLLLKEIYLDKEGKSKP